MRAPTRYDDFIQMICFLDNSKDTLLIDVGANIGSFASDFRTFFPCGQSWLFEPNPECIAKIGQRFADHSDFVIQPYGIGEEASELVLRVPDGKAALGTFHGYNKTAQEHYGDMDYSTYSVEVRPIDDFQFKPSENTVLKIDTQGHEVDVLRGGSAILDRVDLVLIECSFAPIHEGCTETFGECVSILASHDLVPVVFQRFGQKVSTYAFERDVVFVRRQMARSVYHSNYGRVS
ncbi:FkbM family methyltransferase [bacterium AH-315-P15]|nr:FkbM family methyltransferase [bacterium AH-315-P15]